MGCSNGGREAMMAAQRYPAEFDGVVAGNPGFHLSAASLTQAWDVEHLMKAAPNGDLSKALTQEDLDQVAEAILNQCDANDGLEDGVVAAPSQCHFDLKQLRGALPDNKLDALSAVMAGPHDQNGHALYSDWPFDPGIASDGWRTWKLGFSGEHGAPALDTTIGPESLTRLFMTPPRNDMPEHLDFGALARNVAQVGGYFDADETYLSTFAARGGKLLIFQGMADPVFSANDITRWKHQAQADTNGDFVRLFLVPGMTHCGGGPAFDDFDPLTALEKWTQDGVAPQAMPATGNTFPGRRMPICAHPTEAHYIGGDKNAITSYRCE